MTASPSVAIVILNWNGKHFLEKFLPSVLASAYPNKKIIIADNASTDDSVSFLQQQFPNVSIISLPNNYGFAKGYNEALKQVDADYFLLLNSDVEVDAGWIEPLIMQMESYERIGACQPRILSFNDKHLFEYAGAAGGWIDILGYPFSRGRIFDICEEDRGQYNDTSQIFWASGAAMMVRSKIYSELGGFDEFFFAHQEEIDLCWRMQLAGYRIFSVPASVVYHVGGGTLPKGNTRKTFLNFRNNLVMLTKNLPFSEKWWKLPLRMALDQVSAVKELFSGKPGYFIAVIRAHLAYINWLFTGKKKRLLHRKKLNQLSGVYKGSLVWQHFIMKQEKFSSIVKEKNAGNSF